MNDLGASILTKLKTKSVTTRTPFQTCLQLFFQEEFLRRLSKSRFSEQLILKGGLLIYAITNFKSRSTVDIDFLLRNSDNSTEHMDTVLREILDTPSGNNDTIVLKANRCTQISKQRKYSGVTAQIIGHLKNVRVPFDIDIGIGDIIVPKIEKHMFTTQLDGFEQPEIFIYSLESTIAEKLDAIIQRLDLTSRMKDFYDIDFLSRTFNYDGNILKKAILATLNERGTRYDTNTMNSVINLISNGDLLIKWNRFLKTIHIEEVEFRDVVQQIDLFLRPILNSIVNKEEFLLHWICTENKWDKL